jgi:hypothetical protein
VRRPLLVALVAAGVVAGVLLLRAELMTVEVPDRGGSYTDVTITATTREDGSALREMTLSLVRTCRHLVNADIAAQSFVEDGVGRYAFRLRPGLDEFERREMRGCLQDTRVQHLLLEVHSIQTLHADDPAEVPPPVWKSAAVARR